MMVERQAHWGAAALTYLLALLLTLAPMGRELIYWQPEWFALVVMYWTFRSPGARHLIYGWCVGLLLDVLEGGLLGLNALALSFVAYMTVNLYQRMRMFPAWQQAFVVFVVIAIAQMFYQWVKNLLGHSIPPFSFVWSATSSALMWPILSFFLLRVRF